LSEVRIGLAPAVISPYVVKAIGERATRRLAISAERISGEQARALGLLTETAPADALEALLERRGTARMGNSPQAMRASKARALGARRDGWGTPRLANSPPAMRERKALVQEASRHSPTPELRRHTEQSIARIRVSPEGQEGLRAFLEKRPPNWSVEPES